MERNTGIEILGAGEFRQRLQAHRSWLIMPSRKNGGGGLKTVSKSMSRERETGKLRISFLKLEVDNPQLGVQFMTPLQLLLFHPLPPTTHIHTNPLYHPSLPLCSNPRQLYSLSPACLTLLQW